MLGLDAPRGIKGVKFRDRSKALRSVWNAAWDMTYVQEWFRRVNAQHDDAVLNVLCTRDLLMHRIGELLRKVMYEPGNEEELFERAGFSRSVIELYKERGSTKNNSKRALVPLPNDFPAYRRKLLAGLKAEFLLP